METSGRSKFIAHQRLGDDCVDPSAGPAPGELRDWSLRRRVEPPPAAGAETFPPRAGATRPRSTGSSLAVTPAPQAPTWSRWPQAPAIVLHRPHLKRTLTIALVVGTMLFCINQLDVVVHGGATRVVWLKAALTYAVPFVVSNLGVLTASRRPEHRE